MSDDLRWRVAAFLREHHVMTLATRDEAAGVWAAAVFYVHDEAADCLHFLSSARSRHASNLARDDRVAVTIQRDYHDWPEITGLQAEGRVRMLEGPAREHARALYAARFPLVGSSAAGSPIAQALLRVHWYCFVPQRLYLIDNRLGFGHRDEWVAGR